MIDPVFPFLLPHALRDARRHGIPVAWVWLAYRREIARRTLCRLGVHRIIKLRDPIRENADWRCPWCGQAFPGFGAW